MYPAQSWIQSGAGAFACQPAWPHPVRSGPRRRRVLSRDREGAVLRCDNGQKLLALPGSELRNPSRNHLPNLFERYSSPLLRSFDSLLNGSDSFRVNFDFFRLRDFQLQIHHNLR